MRRYNIVVIGAGVTGLTTAFELSKNIRYSVTVVAKEMPGDSSAEYASAWAGATIIPSSQKSMEAQNWDADGWPEFDRLASTVPEAGIEHQEAILFNNTRDDSPEWFFNAGLRKPWFVDALPNYRVNAYSPLPPDVSSTAMFTTVCINPAVYLPYLVAQCLKAGVVFERGVLSHIQEAESMHHTMQTADLVINCTGLFSAKLGGVKDENVFPVRGQVVIVSEDPGCVMSMAGPNGNEAETTFMMRRAAGGGTFLGGTYEPNNWSLDPDPEFATRIMKRCVALNPAITKGSGIEAFTVIRHGVGLRPSRRGGIRIETQKIGALTVIHNYGHSGGGYQASYGCAYCVVRKTEEYFATCT